MTASASDRVLDVPELLEHILFQLACLSPNNIHSYSKIENVQPAFQLFPIQRVCTAFRDSIHASNKLLRTMFLPANSKKKAAHHGSKDHLAPFWFGEQLDLLVGRTKSTDKSVFFYDRLTLPHRCLNSELRVKPQTELSEAFLREGASWREMQISEQAADSTFHALYRCLPRCDEFFSGAYTVAWRFGEVQTRTLGALYRCVQEVRTRDAVEHSIGRDLAEVSTEEDEVVKGCHLVAAG